MGLLLLGVLFLCLSFLHFHGHITGADGAVRSPASLLACLVPAATHCCCTQAIGCLALGLITILPGKPCVSACHPDTMC